MVVVHSNDRLFGGQVDAGHSRRDHSSPSIPGSGHLTIFPFQSLGSLGPMTALDLGQ